MTDVKRLQASADASLASGYGNVGSAATLWFGAEPLNSSSIIVLKFNVSSIPSTATVSEATLQLTTDDAGSSFSRDVHRLVRDWTEADADWSDATSGDTWATAGAGNSTTDYTTPAIGSATIPAGDNSQFEVALTASAVEGWIQGTFNNYGLRIDGSASGGDSGLEREIHSREASIIAYRPLLIVRYVVPPLTFSVNAGTAIAGIRARWQPQTIASLARGKADYSDWQRHIWSAELMSMTNYQALKALIGTSLTELKTTLDTAPNSQGTYTTARLLTISGQQRGTRFENVQIEFLVNTS